MGECRKTRVASGYDQLSALKGTDQVFGMKFELFEADLLNLLLIGEIGLLLQFFQPLSIEMMFRMQTIKLCAQRCILYLVHQAPPFFLSATKNL